MLSQSLRLSANISIRRSSRSVFQFARSGYNPRTTILATNLRDDFTLEGLKDSVKDIKEIVGLELQPGCTLHYTEETSAMKALEALKKANFGVCCPSRVCRQILHAYVCVDDD